MRRGELLLSAAHILKAILRSESLVVCFGTRLAYNLIFDENEVKSDKNRLNQAFLKLFSAFKSNKRTGIQPQ